MAKQRLPKEDFLPHAPSDVGTRIHINHTACTAGRDTKERLYIFRHQDGVGAYCHNCGLSGFEGSGKPMSLAAIKKALEARDIDQTVPLADVAFPPDTIFSDKIKEWPAKARAWLYKHRFTDLDIGLWVIGYSKELGRVILPVFEGPLQTELLAWQGRSIDGREPKYITTKGVAKPAYWLRSTTHRTIVIVEDILSTLRVGAYQDVVGLLGTSLSDEARLTIGKEYDRAVIWLDPDKAGQDAAQKIHKSLSPIMRGGCDIVTSLVQPKECSDETIEKILSGYRTPATTATSGPL